MIRLFSKSCKKLLDIHQEESFFVEATNSYDFKMAQCPSCGATGKLSGYGHYSRNLVYYRDAKVIEAHVYPRRFSCRSCETTHALLPGTIITPYSPYSLSFKLMVLAAYFEREMTVAAVCKRYNIAISTLYAWKERFNLHKTLLLGALVSRKKPALAFICSLLESVNISGLLKGFYFFHAFSFMQNKTTTAAYYRPP